MVKGCKVQVSTICFVSLFLIIQVFFLPGASAQEKHSWDTATKKKADLGAIIVTAEKQEKNVQDVPVAITVMDTLEIDDRQINSVNDLIDFVPNMLNFKDSMLTANKITSRGLAAPVLARESSAVGMYIDGVPSLGNLGFEAGIVDIERIEVLRGPQGTLYGKNTQVGAINIITSQPDNEFKAKISARGGQWLSSESGDKLTNGASLSVSGPIMEDKLFFGLAGEYRHKDGFMYNTFSKDAEYEQDNYYGRGKLRWTPLEHLDISLLFSYLNYKIDGNDNRSLGKNGAGMFGIPVLSNYRNSSDLKGRQEAKNYFNSLKISYAFNDEINLTSITSIKDDNLEIVSDYDLSPAHIMHGYQIDPGMNSEKISQELRLDSVSRRLNWLVGIYYDKDDVEKTYFQTSMIPEMNSAMDLDQTGEAYAVFGQAGYFLTEKLKVIAGLRYEHQDFEMERSFSSEKLKDSWEKISPKIGAEYHVNPDIMAYIDVSEGYRTGGFNMVATDSKYYSYDDESLWAYELGLKTLFMDKRLMLNTALFYMDITDMQVEEMVDPSVSWITNAAEATSYGLELELSAHLTDNLTLMGGFGYTNVEFDKYKDIDGDYSGKKNPYAPDYTFNISGQYRSGKGYFARMDFIGYGKMYFDKVNEYSRDSYQIVNTKIGYETNNFDIYLYGKNIFDEKYHSDYTNGFYVINSSPGEIGLEIVGRF